MNEHLNIHFIKLLGKEKNDGNLDKLIEYYFNKNISLDIKREIISSIGRQKNKEKILSFLKDVSFLKCNSMDMIYQIYRTCLYHLDTVGFSELAQKIELYYDNEIIKKMKLFYDYKKSGRKFKSTISSISKPSLLAGDTEYNLQKIRDKNIKLIFTSPPYYNAKEYSTYNSYVNYITKMEKILIQCHRVLEDGRFIIINVSPVITKRPGREFESIRYPIHFDFHHILKNTGFEFIDEIIWLKPEYSVPSRNGGYIQTQKPLSYKPNCITESVMVYRKQAPFLLDANIKEYKDHSIVFKDSFDETNCWLISPVSSKKHPAIFPKILCEKIIHYYSFKNDVVLDPFGGSGTFGDVAIDMDRIPVLSEKHEDYIKLLLKKGYHLIK